MKKMKTKRLFAVLLTLAMVLGMTSMAFADPTNEDPITPPSGNPTEYTTPVGHKPDQSDTTTGAVFNVEAGATVMAYRIVKPNYNDEGFTGFEAVSVGGIKIANVESPTSAEVTSIAAIIAEHEGNPNWMKDELTPTQLKAPEGVTTGLTTYSHQLGAGQWLVLVTKQSDATKIYNPMLIGVYYSLEGSGSDSTLVSGGAVDANSSWNLTSEGAYAKSEEPTIDKKIIGSNGNGRDGHENESGNDVSIGDIVNFEIETQIPSYSEAYRKVTVEITDTLSKGLSLADPLNLVVKVGGTEDANIVSGDGIAYTYTSHEASATSGAGFTISFLSDFALEHSGQKVYVTYDARLNEDAGLNFDKNTNEATLKFTHDPNGNTTEKKDKTYTYTFGIDTTINGNGSYQTGEIFKTTDGETTLVTGSAISASAISNPLSGAAFSLTKVTSEAAIGADGKITYTVIKGAGAVSKTAVSKDDGRLTFEGLDAGKYILKETAAPNGYSLNEEEHLVVIEATYVQQGEFKGMLNGYTITIDGKETSTYTDSSAQLGGGEITITERPTFIKNTKLSGLPSTGGIGTTIFTIAGCLIMILAAALFFASRRKSSKK